MRIYWEITNPEELVHADRYEVRAQAFDNKLRSEKVVRVTRRTKAEADQEREKHVNRAISQIATMNALLRNQLERLGKAAVAGESKELANACVDAGVLLARYSFSEQEYERERARIRDEALNAALREVQMVMLEIAPEIRPRALARAYDAIRALKTNT